MPRRSTRGPLDGDDPLASAAATVGPTVPKEHQPSSPAGSTAPSTQSPLKATVVEQEEKDFSILLRPDIFHAIPTTDIPAAFRISPTEEQASASLDNLVATGNFRFAAEQAVAKLKSVRPTDHQQIFSLYYTRLACLQLLGLHHQAAQEVRALQDFHGPFYRDPSGVHLAPWELRLLVIRLQAIGFGDWRRGIMGYFELGRECRFRARKGTPAQRPFWEARLRDLRVRVSNALVEMGDFDSAILQLEQQDNASRDAQATMQLALINLRVGRVAAASKLVHDLTDDEPGNALLHCICLMADGKYEEATTAWRSVPLDELDSGTRMVVAQNLAVCLVYSGRVEEAQTMLEQQVQNGHYEQSLTFNLATVYELSSDRAKELKSLLADKAAAHPAAPTGWEKPNIDFKL